MNKNFLIVSFSVALYCMLFAQTLIHTEPPGQYESWDKRYAAPQNIQQLQDQLEARFISRQLGSRHPTVDELSEQTAEKSLELRLDKLTKNITTPENPSSEELHAYFELHKEEYRKASTLSLDHVTYTITARGGNSVSAAHNALSISDKIVPVGDETPLPRHFTDVSSLQLDEIFGEPASLAIINLARRSPQLPCWGGPITSAYGVHLVCIKQFELGKIPPFSEARLQVLNDWRYETASKKGVR